MKINKFFTDIDLENIKKAVAQAESKTSGEIVPCFAETSDTYEVVFWRGLFLVYFAFAFIFYLYKYFSSSWIALPIYWYLFVIPAFSLLIAYILFLIPQTKRFLAGKKLMEQHVSQKAHEYFLKNEVFKTNDRTGILIYLSLFEKLVYVLGDSGINSKVEKSSWDNVVSKIISGIKQGKNAEGLIDGIKECGLLLQRNGLKHLANDSNELADNLIVED